MATDGDTPARRAVLRQQGLLNPAAEAVLEPRFSSDPFFDPHDLVQVRYEMLRSVRSGERSATDAATAYGVSRATYYGTLSAFEAAGIAGLIPEKRGPRGPHKLTEEVMRFVSEQIVSAPDLDAAAVAQRITEVFGVSVHPRSVERALARHRSKKALGRG